MSGSGIYPGGGGGGGSGNVTGPGSSTDNALVRWNGVAGTIIKNSTATLSDAGIITAGNFVGGGGSLTGLNANQLTAGTVQIARGGTGAATVANNLVFVGPTAGGPLAPSFRLLVAGDIPSLSGTYLPIAGGTMTGGLLFTDNAVDIGATGATRPRTIFVGTSIVIQSGANTVASWNPPQYNYASSALLRWSNSSANVTTIDVGIGRSAAGVLEVNSGVAATTRDLSLRELLTAAGSFATPAIAINTTVGIYSQGAGIVAFTNPGTAYARGVFGFVHAANSGGGQIGFAVDGDSTTAPFAQMSSVGSFGWTASATDASGASDLALARLGAASLQQGKAASATPVAQTFTLGESSRPGTDSNVGGSSGTFRSGLGTGIGIVTNLTFQTPTQVGSGTATQTYATRLTIATAGITSTVPIIGTNLTLSGATSAVLNFTGAVSGAGAQTATMTNGPTAGNPAIWIPIQHGGATRYIPAWA